MDMENLNVNLTLDEQGKILRADHSLEPLVVAQMTKKDSLEWVAAAYIKKVFNFKKVLPKAISEIDQKRRKKSSKQEGELWLKRGGKKIRNLSVVEFEQYHNGIRVWKKGMAVTLEAETGKVVEATSSFDHGIPKIRFSLAKLETHTETLDEKKLEKLLALSQNKKRLEIIRKDLLAKEIPVREGVLDASFQLEVMKRDQVVYQYDPTLRKHQPHKEKNSDLNLVERILDLFLPPVNKAIEPYSYRIVSEIFFSSSLGNLKVYWHAFVDHQTDSVLYIRALVDMVQATGYVYDRDPLTTTGNPTIAPSSPTSVLNGPRTPRPLPTVNLPELKGEYVEIKEICPIPAAPPTSNSGKFDYDADVDDFAAVNAYYHTDAAYRMVAEMGIDMTQYFHQDSLPAEVDHRGSFSCVNAAFWMQRPHQYTYGLVEAGQPMGIATDVRLVLHEFGHAILYDNVDDGRFGFAHSLGDSLGAVFCDPGSKAPDRFLTFPWITGITRRHDRNVALGWAWGGAQDDQGYLSEQILSTSHFRAYLAMGGDHPDLCEREWAARYLTFLMILAVGGLTPVTNPNNPEDWSDRLQLHDKLTKIFEGHAGGAVHKIIRWAFEKQGAYQLPGAPSPIVTRGAPPDIDVYINDGRNGEYDFTEDWCHTKEIWNRICPDGKPAHQSPIPGITNYAYVIVRNRGTKETRGGTVKAYHKRDNACCGCCNDCGELSWPDDFVPMITEKLEFKEIPSGDYEIVGPFVWIPKPGDCILMVAEGEGGRGNSYPDPSNIRFIEKGQHILTKRLVPLDNNIALRCLCKQCNPDYSRLGSPCPKPLGDSH